MVVKVAKLACERKEVVRARAVLTLRPGINSRQISKACSRLSQETCKAEKKWPEERLKGKGKGREGEGEAL